MITDYVRTALKNESEEIILTDDEWFELGNDEIDGQASDLQFDVAIHNARIQEREDASKLGRVEGR